MNNIENCIGSGVKITQVEFNIGLNGHMYTENGVAVLLRQAGFKLYDDAYFVYFIYFIKIKNSTTWKLY